MTCDDVRRTLLEGSAEPHDARVALHVASCAACRRLRDRVEAVASPGLHLRREIDPTRDLWPAIAARIERPRRPRAVPRRVLALAATLLLGVALAVLFSPPEPEPEPEPVSESVPESVPETVAIPLLSPATYVTPGFDRTRAMLARRITPESTEAPGTSATLASLDGAIRQVENALRREPTNPRLSMQLSRLERKQIELLSMIAADASDASKPQASQRAS